MQLALLSDVHGNLPALEAVLRDIDRHDVDVVIVAGDLTSGPQQVEVIDRLRSITEWIIRGNNEDYLLAHRAGEVPAAWWTSEQWAMMRWSYEQLDAETLDFIAALPHQRVIEFDRLGPVRILHGSPRSPSEHLFPDQDPEAMAVFRWAGMLPAEQEPVPLEAVLGGVAEPVVVCGHSHIPWQQALPNQLLINPGSAGAANNGDHRAQYALLTEEAGHVTVAFRQLLQLLSHPRYRTRRVLPVLPLFLPVVLRLVGAAIRDVGRVGVSRTAVAGLSRTRSRATDGRGSGIGVSNG